MNKVIDLCLSKFKQSLHEVSPSECVKKALHITSTNHLHIRNNVYELHENVHIVAFGKAALSMVVGAEEQLGRHVIRGIASVPVGTRFI
uniref:MOFRL-associated domain-containing protein n=1 Tax=Acrobeloides nanus TaxID=290746 RepID=A0A914CHG3_9BILA